ncbi:MAG: hypothetical protein JSS86_15435 [Cyanobacteria bacterium SZAS LIN-2]|nr:hypothetical protein [Cyanobacteria bacterium SZAS LIN-3]MBS1997714.1 hypothetical protein [Cyanobacteria bacterium SZAS LIN-2]
MDNHHDVPAQNGTENVSTAAQQQLMNEAMTRYYVCKDGTVVTNPKDCVNDNGFPSLEINHKI